MSPQGRWRGLGWAALGGLLIAALHVSFWFGAGRNEFNMHWGYPDRMLGYGELRLYLLHLLLGLPAGLCFAQALRGTRAIESFDWNDFWRSRRGLLVPAGLAVVVAFSIAQFTTHHAWFTDDEQAYLLQSKLYARGALTMPVIEPRAIIKHGFTVEVLPRDGVAQWTGVYPPLQPFMMTLSSFLGSPNLSQFLCVGLIVYHAARLARRVFGTDDAAVVVAWLCGTSPLLLGLGATFHTSVLGTLLSVLTARLFLWNFERAGWRRGLPLGVVAGTIVLCRPLEGTLVVSLCGLGLLGLLVSSSWGSDADPPPDRNESVRGPAPNPLRAPPGAPTPVGASHFRPRGRLGGEHGGWRAALASLVGFGLGGLLPLAVMVKVNLALTGHPLQGAYSILEAEIGRFIGFGDDMMWNRRHDAELGILQTVTALVRVNAFAFGWPLSLGLVGLSLCRPFRDRRVLVLLGISFVHLVAYFFLAFGSVHDFGHAYHVWHLPTLAMASAWVLLRARELARSSELWAAFARWQRLAVAGMGVAALAVFWPAQLTRWRDVSEIILAPVRAAEAATAGEPSVVLWTTIQPPGTQRTWVFRPPAPHPDSHIIWAYDSAAWYPQLKQHLPDRAFYRLTWKGEKPVVSRVKL